MAVIEASKRKDLFKRNMDKSIIKELMQEYDLKRNEAVLFIAIFGKNFKDDYSIDLKEIVENFELNDRQYVQLLSDTKSLQDKGLVVYEKDRRGRKSLINPKVMIDEGVFNYIISGKDLFSDYNFSDIYSIVELASFLIDQREEDKITEHKFFKEIQRLVDKVDMKLPLYRLLKPYSPIEQVMLFYAIKDYIGGRNGSSVSTLSEEIYDTLSKRAWLIRTIWDEKLKIVNDKILELDHEGHFKNDPEFLLTDKTVSKLFTTTGNRKKGEMQYRPSFLKYLIYPKLKINLFLNNKNQKEINLLSGILSKKKFGEMREKLHQNNFQNGVICLFYGPSGTGKTASVFNIASKSKRDILQVDISTIKDCWVGKSEKNMKKVFEEYKHVKEELQNEPILLFNEADALISRRMNINTSVDQMNNTLQNILLEELENFDGILIATSNLVENLDDAFSRRFLYKIEFEPPDKAARLNIWKDKLQGPSEKMYEILAEFEITGAQIENIAKKYLLNSIINCEVLKINKVKQMIEEDILFKRKKYKHQIGF
jgi:DNA polymerase III delta prime subunit